MDGAYPGTLDLVNLVTTPAPLVSVTVLETCSNLWRDECLHFAIGPWYLWCRGSQPKHVSNPASRSLTPFNVYDYMII